jgi:hypothetical protein
MVTEWYRKYLGTKYEGGNLPYLYHHYVGHDDNRDWYMLTQIETKNVNQAVYHEWFPQFWLDEHQMGWDVTDFGSGRFGERGLGIFCVRNGRQAVAEEKLYAEKLLVVGEKGSVEGILKIAMVSL